MSINDISSQGPDDTDLSDAFRQAKRRVNSVTSPWEFACNWYRVDEIVNNIARRQGFGADQPPIPKDVNSREFAEWLAHEYRLAMNKGIEIGRNWEANIMRTETITYELKDGPRRYKVVFRIGQPTAYVEIDHGTHHEYRNLPYAETTSIEAERLCRDAFPLVEKTNKP